MYSQDKQDERDFILKIIKLYEKLPALWNLKSKDYTDRNKKQQQYEILLRKYQERYRGADKLQLLKKFNSLRTNFRKEVRRINEAKKNGSGEICPTLWYYDDMKFLLSLENEMANRDLSTAATNCLKKYNSINHKVEQKYLINRNEIKKKMPYHTNREPTTTKGLNLEQNNLKVLPTVPKRVFITSNNISSPTHMFSEQNEFEQIAAFWTIELQKMDASQQLFAKKAINDILFEGQLGNLHRNSIEINRMSQVKSSSRGNNYFLSENASLTSQTSIVYQDEDLGNLKYEIEHIDPIEVDNINNSTSEYNEEEMLQHIEIVSGELHNEDEEELSNDVNQ